MSEPGTTSGGKCAMIAIVGRANVGKSTLINALLEEKVSIVSPVPQTTRTLLRGILTEPRGQLVLLDTPGVHQADYDLGRLMNKKARAAVEGVDLIMLVLDRSHPPSLEDEGWIKRLVKSTLPVLAVLNKSDRSSRHDNEIKALWEKAVTEYSTPASILWIEVSGLKGDGVKELRDLLFDQAPFGPPLFPADILTDYPRKWTISDIVREKLFLVLKEELPHAVAVQVDSIEEHDNDWTVQVTIYVDKPSQKPIVLGVKGRLLRRVRRSAEIELCTLYARNINLRLWVKVEKNWNRNFWFLKKVGYTE